MPHEMPLLSDLLILLIVSLPIVYICHKMRLPVLVGFMATGILIGPSALGFIKSSQEIELLAEIGVALLLFTIGLEFSLKRLMEMKRLVLLGGGLQVILTTAIVYGIEKLFKFPFNQAIFFGFLISLSSTAIVLKTYLDRVEIDSPHGRGSVGILLFQDLCIVPMMLLVPILSGQEGASVGHIAFKLGEAALLVLGIIFTTHKIVPYLLSKIVGLRSNEIFLIFIVFISLGTAWLTSQFGLSMALGAFIAGLVMSESEYSHQISSDILPFRDVFNSIFFISIGMLLSLSSLAANYPRVILWLAAIITGKTIIIALVAKLLKYSLRISLLMGVGLAQVGEFSFILAKVGSAQNLITPANYQLFLASAILSMTATPFLIGAAPRVYAWIESWPVFGRIRPPRTDDADKPGFNLKNHVIVVGYGMNGRHLSKVLHRLGVPYIVLDLNAETVRSTKRKGVPIEFGDSGRRQVLHHSGVKDAAIMVIAISDPVATRRTVVLARELNPDLHIIVRTRYMAEVKDLVNLGASEVIPEEYETSLEIFSRVLKEFGASRNTIESEVDRIRKEGYEMLRSTSLPFVEINRFADALKAISTETVFIVEDFPVTGKSLQEIELRRLTGATVTAVIRNGEIEVNPGPELKIEVNDILVLLGSSEQTVNAIDYIKSGTLDNNGSID